MLDPRAVEPRYVAPHVIRRLAPSNPSSFRQCNFQLLLLLIVVAVLSVIIVHMVLELPRKDGEIFVRSSSNEQYYKDPFNRRMLVILTSQSSEAQRLLNIFNQDEKVLQVIEPLDSVFVTLYGTNEGWNAPADIFTYSDGSPRTLTSQEQYSMAEVSNALLTCNIASLPSELLLHRFWSQFALFQKAAQEYKECVSSSSLLATCLAPLQTECGIRFQDNEKSQKCMNRLYTVFRSNNMNSSVPLAEVALWTTYSQCLSNARNTIFQSGCVQKLEQICLASKAVVIKVVRGGATYAEELLQINPNVKFIHFIRNPITSSGVAQTLDASTKGAYSNGNVTMDTTILCNHMKSELLKLRALGRMYPFSFMQLTQEKLLTDPVEETQRIYSFIHKDVPNQIRQWLRDPSLSVSPKKWDDFYDQNVARSLMSICSDVYGMVDLPEWHTS